MKLFLVILIGMVAITGEKTIYDFSKNDNASGWQVINDGVMGGMSKGYLAINNAGNGLFHGYVSLENNGGFSSVRYRCEQVNVSPYSTAVIRLKGDGKRYQFRVKTNREDRHAYIQYFNTTGDWQLIEIDLDKMYPTFRGRQLNMPNYPVYKLEEVAFLIANKRAEAFQLEIDYIRLR
ncbi:CIA30 family protein [Carboxylicivirga sediminis]|uniref:CIA30 family protein n=1 Tax=Carboxylicivirga sediminis TaxID=2006564 RepID=A0A941EZ14_9BACT|nr:CIA30 family protein [Carboxylicivirga sediminis]MBR8534191.1 CIA30 family protein [Carboxylicivirga sediminis]